MLDHFVAAQDRVYEQVLAELRAGRKETHWMWFIFPQLAGLGRSETATFFGIRSLDEARAYLAHPVLGTRLRECVGALQDLMDMSTSAERVFGAVDAMKLRSSLTLFAEAGAGPLFTAALERWFGGDADPATLSLLNA